MTIHLTFDDMPTGTLVTTQYEHRKGVIFTSPCAVIEDEETFNHRLQSNYRISHANDTMNVIRGRFVTPKHMRLAVTVSHSNTSIEGVYAMLRIFNAKGEKLNECAFASPSSHATAEITSLNGNIASFEVCGRVGQFDCIDSLSFDTLPPPDFSMSYEANGKALILRAQAGESVIAHVKVMHNHGSSGEILLSMPDPCPGTTWCFNPPSVHTGDHSVDVKIQAVDGIPIGPEFDVKILGIPRSRTSGQHERLIIIPVQVVPPTYPSLD
jgi:hypothetical protein